MYSETQPGGIESFLMHSETLLGNTFWDPTGKNRKTSRFFREKNSRKKLLLKNKKGDMSWK